MANTQIVCVFRRKGKSLAPSYKMQRLDFGTLFRKAFSLEQHKVAESEDRLAYSNKARIKIRYRVSSLILLDMTFGMQGAIESSLFSLFRTLYQRPPKSPTASSYDRL